MDNTLYNSSSSFPNDTGIYAIYFLNSKNDKIYIGSASRTKNKYTNGFNYRWKMHLNSLRKNKHHSIKLQNAYSKYGENNLVFLILENCNSENCLKIEQLYINLFNSYNFGYNCRPNAQNMLNFKQTEESISKVRNKKTEWRNAFKEKIKNLYLNNKTSREIGEILGINHRTVIKIIKDFGDVKIKKRADYIKIKIYQYDNNGNYINSFNSAYEAANILNIEESNIRRVLKGLSVLIKGYHFNYLLLTKNEIATKITNWLLESKIKRSNAIKIANTSELKEQKRIASIGNHHRKRIENIKQLDLDGNLIKIWKDSKEIVNFYKLKNASPILRVLNGKRKKWKNYKWEKSI